MKRAQSIATSLTSASFWVLCLQISFFQLGFAMVSPILPLYAHSFGVTETAIGWVLGIYGMARFLSNMPAVALSQKIGLRSLFTVGSLLVGIGSIACGWAPNFGLLLLFRVITGAGSAITMLAGQIRVATPPEGMSRARALSYYQGFALTGIALGPLPGGWLAEWFGLQAPFYIYGVLSTFVAIGNLFLQPDDRNGRLPSRKNEQHAMSRRSEDARRAGAVDESANRADRVDGRPERRPTRQAPRRPSFGQLCRDTAFLAGASIAFFQFFARTGGVNNLVPLLGAHKLGLSPSSIGTVLFLTGVWILLATFLSGGLVDRLGFRRVLIPATISGCIGLFLFAVGDSFASYLFAGVFWGLSAGFSGSVSAAYVAERVHPDYVGAALGTYRTVADAGYIFGPVIMGAMAEQAGAGNALFIASLLMLFDAAFFAWASSRNKQTGSVRQASPSL